MEIWLNKGTIVYKEDVEVGGRFYAPKIICGDIRIGITYCPWCGTELDRVKLPSLDGDITFLDIH